MEAREVDCIAIGGWVTTLRLLSADIGGSRDEARIGQNDESRYCERHLCLLRKPILELCAI